MDSLLWLRWYAIVALANILVIFSSAEWFTSAQDKYLVGEIRIILVFLLICLACIEIITCNVDYQKDSFGTIIEDITLRSYRCNVSNRILSYLDLADFAQSTFSINRICSLNLRTIQLLCVIWLFMQFYNNRLLGMDKSITRMTSRSMAS